MISTSAIPVAMINPGFVGNVSSVWEANTDTRCKALILIPMLANVSDMYGKVADRPAGPDQEAPVSNVIASTTLNNAGPPICNNPFVSTGKAGDAATTPPIAPSKPT